MLCLLSLRFSPDRSKRSKTTLGCGTCPTWQAEADGRGVVALCACTQPACSRSGTQVQRRWPQHGRGHHCRCKRLFKLAQPMARAQEQVPGSPKLPRPQMKMRPSSVSAMVCVPPHTACTTLQQHGFGGLSAFTIPKAIKQILATSLDSLQQPTSTNHPRRREPQPAHSLLVLD